MSPVGRLFQNSFRATASSEGLSKRQLTSLVKRHTTLKTDVHNEQTDLQTCKFSLEDRVASQDEQIARFSNYNPHLQLLQLHRYVGISVQRGATQC